MTNNYRFSVVIPTRNRPETLRYSLQTCLDQREFDDYEIVINDNGDNGETQRLVAQICARDPRAKDKVKYHKRADVCSMSRNFEDAIGRTEGEYVIVIGDDDGVLPMALYELDRLIKDTGAGVIKWSNGLYNWPTMTMQGAANYLGFCLLRGYRLRDGREELGKALTNLSYERLPMLYINAAIRRDVIEAVRDGEGRLFRSRAPDVYSAITLAYFCGQYIETTLPLSLAGLSRSSNGVSTAFGGSNPEPRRDFVALNAQDGIYLHGAVPNLPIHPIVDLADSFSLAKGFYFSGDDSLVLSREQLMKACVERCDTDVQEVRQELLRACFDDKDLTDYVVGLMASNTTRREGPRLRPAHLGADGVNLHLDASDFSVTNVQEATALVHRIIWPRNAQIRYDLKHATAF